MNGERTFWLVIGCAALAAAPAAWAQSAAKPPEKPAAEPLGRIFFTPAQRASLDIARTRRARNTLATERSDEPAAPVAQSITYDGMVRRSDGKSTVWINSRAYNENEQVSGPVVGRVRPDGGVRLQLPQSSRSVDLKVGQTVELVSGAVEEPYSRKPVATAFEGKPGTKPATGKPGVEKPATKPVPTENTLSEREQEFRDRQRLEDAMRAVQDAAPSKPAAVPPSEGPAR